MIQLSIKRWLRTVYSRRIEYVCRRCDSNVCVSDCNQPRAAAEVEASKVSGRCGSVAATVVVWSFRELEIQKQMSAPYSFSVLMWPPLWWSGLSESLRSNRNKVTVGQEFLSSCDHHFYSLERWRWERPKSSWLYICSWMGGLDSSEHLYKCFTTVKNTKWQWGRGERNC